MEMTDVLAGIEYGSNGKDTNLLSDMTRNKYNTIQECDEMAYSFEKSWTNHKHQIFTYQVFIYELGVKENIHSATKEHHLQGCQLLVVIYAY